VKNLDKRLAAAVSRFWKTRERQSEEQGGGSGDRERDGRSAVTGGAQMDGFVELVSDLLVESGIPNATIFRDSKLELPGFFRPTKEWDLLVVVQGHLLAAMEFDRMAAQLRALAPADWAQPTACGLWDVRALAAHVLGMAEAQASFRQFAHDFRAAGKRSGGKMIDEMTATQVRERAAMTPAAITSRLAAVAPRAVRARRRTPALMRWAVRIKNDPPFDAERWRYGYLVDTIFTRDTWMHRLDISRATGHPMELTAEHDGRLVADIVAEWARRHGQQDSQILESARQIPSKPQRGAIRPMRIVDREHQRTALSQIRGKPEQPMQHRGRIGCAQLSRGTPRGDDHSRQTSGAR